MSESLTAENEELQSLKEALDGNNSKKWKEALGGNNSKKWKETLDGNNSKKWKKALDAEYSSLISNETWELVPPPKDANIVGSKWVLKVKQDAYGNINRYKARLIAQGYSQTQGVLQTPAYKPHFFAQNFCSKSGVRLICGNICNGLPCFPVI